MIRKMVAYLVLVIFCAFLCGCTSGNNAAPKIKSHSSKVKELRKQYEEKSGQLQQNSSQKYSYDNDQLKIDLK